MRNRIVLLVVCVLSIIAGGVNADSASKPANIEYTKETLANGLRVLYIPMHNAPVVHVRVMYHVGSRDEREDRQGFAHMFEHMMFRGSAHVAPEEHMKRINGVGGQSNAFTSFDQTTYVNTVPSNQVELPLYMEADRMASFKVSDSIYQIERNVVAKEWGIRQNRPYGTMWEDYLGAVYKKNSYRWTPIGNMDHLKAAAASELQAFFNKYYVPNNAVLVVSGDIQIENVKPLVQKYFGWIPKGDEIVRDTAVEPEQTEPRRLEVKRVVPLAMVMVGYPIGSWGNEDNYALQMLGTVLGDGRSSRLDKSLVLSEKPQCTSASAGPFILQGAGLFSVHATLLQGKNLDEVEKAVNDQIALIVEKGVTQEELDRAKMQARKQIIEGRATCESLAKDLGEEELFGNDAEASNREWAKYDKLTTDDLLRVARKYLVSSKSTTMRIIPESPAAARAAAMATRDKVLSTTAPVVAGTQPVAPRDAKFPEGYLTSAPVIESVASPKFAKGEETTINGVKTIIMTDHRLPIVTWTLAIRSGSHREDPSKVGLGGITSAMIRRGTKSIGFEQLNADLESRGVEIEITDGGDTTRISGSCMTDQIEHALTRTRQILREPAFPADELEKLREQTINAIIASRDIPASVADTELRQLEYAQSILGRESTPESVKSITLEDVKKFYESNYVPNDAVLVIAGDIDVKPGQDLAAGLLEGWQPRPVPPVEYSLPIQGKRKVILIDNPAAKQSIVRLGRRAYDIRSENKFAGSLIAQILSHGIESRLGKYVRAQKGYAYSVYALFQPTRQDGTFYATTETRFETTAACIEAMFKVFNDMRSEDVTTVELADAKRRVAAGMVMDMQTIQQQATRRLEGILNGYPIDYYDQYPARLNQVTAAQIRAVMNEYSQDDSLHIVVVAPVEKVKEQLSTFGEVEVRLMPNQRSGTTSPSSEMMK